MMLHLYRKAIPKISHDVVRFLRTREYAEIEDTQVIEAELDLSTVMVDYMNKEDRINQEAKAGLQRRHPLDVAAPGVPRGDQADWRSVIAGKRLPIHLVGKDRIAERVEGLFDGDDASIRHARFVRVGGDEIDNLDPASAFGAKRDGIDVDALNTSAREEEIEVKKPLTLQDLFFY